MKIIILFFALPFLILPFVSALWTSNLNEGLEIYYSMDDISGKGIDETIPQTNITNFSAGFIRGVGGIKGMSYEFDGASSYADAENINNSDIRDNTVGTTSIWFNYIKHGEEINNIYVFSDGDYASKFEIRLDDRPANDYISAFLQVNSALSWEIRTTNSLGNVAQGAWHHLVIVQNGIIPKLYLDGVEQSLNVFGSNTGDWYDDMFNSQSPPKELGFGAKNRGGGQFYKGRLDEAGFWNRTLNDTEISQLYNNGNGISYSSDLDNDGIFDGNDNCLNISNPDQNDSDSDNIGDACDNCLLVANQNQADSDSDSLGDSCDICPLDFNNDIDSHGVCGNIDNCIPFPNPDQNNSDLDAFGDVCDCDNADIDLSGGVNLDDLSILAYHWQQEKCLLSNNWCGGADISRGREVGLSDLSILAKNWKKNSCLDNGQAPLIQATLGYSLISLSKTIVEKPETSSMIISLASGSVKKTECLNACKKERKDYSREEVSQCLALCKLLAN